MANALALTLVTPKPSPWESPTLPSPPFLDPFTHPYEVRNVADGTLLARFSNFLCAAATVTFLARHDQEQQPVITHVVHVTKSVIITSRLNECIAVTKSHQSQEITQ